MIDLTIIIPVYNEIKTIEKLLNRVFKINIKKQIIVIDDASMLFTKPVRLSLNSLIMVAT